MTQTKTVICCEKPSAAATFCKALNVRQRYDGYIESDEYIITWAYGHLITMSYPEKYDKKYEKWNMEDLPFLPEAYKYEPIADAGSKKQLSVINKTFHRADVGCIMYAPDPAREGVLIQDTIRKYVKVPDTMEQKVIWIHSLTNEEIYRGIREAKPVSEYDLLIKSAYERAVEDYAIGINLSRALTLKYRNVIKEATGFDKGALVTVGRVMSCVLGMICNREIEIENFTPTDFYTLSITADNIKAEWKAKEGSKYYKSPLLYNEGGFKEKEKAEELRTALLGNAVTIEKAEVKETKKFPPLLFNLAELQAECAKRYKLSPDDTLAVAQSLYEKKYTTYPRTDARVLSEAIKKEINKNVDGLAGLEKVSGFVSAIQQNGYRICGSKYTDDSKISDHYALIPTGLTAGIETLQPVEQKVYELIVRRFLSIFMEPAVYKNVSVVFSCGTEKFYATKKILIKAGYKEVFGKEEDDEENPQIAGLLALKPGDCVIASLSNEIEVGESQTKAPTRYTSGSLILAMENAGKLIEDEELREQIRENGIGTSATRAEIIKKLKKIEYIDIDKAQVVRPLSLGRINYEILHLMINELLQPELTANYEKGLQQIADGKIPAQKYRDLTNNNVRVYVKRIKEADKDEVIKNAIEGYRGYKTQVQLDISCPLCGQKLRRRKNGIIGCESYKGNQDKGCGLYVNTIVAGKQLTDKQITELFTKGRINDIKGFKSKGGKKFTANLLFKDGKIDFEFDEVPDVETTIGCPKCGKHLIKKKWKYECECGFSIPSVIADKELDESVIEQLLTTGVTEPLYGFKSKKNHKPYAAKLWLQDDDTIKMQFI